MGSFQEPFSSSPAKPLKRTTSTRRRKVRRRKTTQTLIPPRSRTHRSASSSSKLLTVWCKVPSLSHQQTKTISQFKAPVCVCHVQRSYCIFSHFYPLCYSSESSDNDT